MAQQLVEIIDGRVGTAGTFLTADCLKEARFLGP
jgi:hypothetical protein